MFPCISTFGDWHEADLDVILKLGRQLARQLGKEEELTRQLRLRLSVLLTINNMAMMGSRTPTLFCVTYIGGNIEAIAHKNVLRNHRVADHVARQATEDLNIL